MKYSECENILEEFSENGQLEKVKFLIKSGSELDAYNVKNYAHQLGKLMVDNINRTRQWKMTKYLPQEYQQQFPKPVVRASQLGLYD